MASASTESTLPSKAFRQASNATTINNKTEKPACEISSKILPYFGKFYPFGSKCVIFDQTPNRKKFVPPGIECILVGLNAKWRILQSRIDSWDS